MVKTFVDAAGWIGVANAKDSLNKPASEILKDLYRRKIPLITTEFVLVEVADAFSAPPLRATLIKFLQGLRNESRLEIVPVSSELMEKGLQFYGQRLDKDWSLTDCISFVVMTEEGITDAFTADHHFRQAGFRTLL